MDKATGNLLEKFETLEIAAPNFHHCDHIRVAYEMLNKYDFVEACARYSGTIRAMAKNAGVPEKFNATITIAFMSVIAERKSQSEKSGFHSFLASNPDLLEKNLLQNWYSRERLDSAAARSQFLMPDRAKMNVEKTA